MAKKDTIRLSLDVSPRLLQALEQLSTDTHGTKSDVIRKAIALMEIAVDAKRHGKKFGITDGDHLTTEIVGI